MQTKLILTLLGILLAILVDVSRRNKNSTNTPSRFDIIFYVKNKWVTHLASALTSMALVLTYHYMSLDVALAHLLSKSYPDSPFMLELIEGILAWTCGFAPHLALALLDSASKIFTPRSVFHNGRVYNRK